MVSESLSSSSSSSSSSPPSDEANDGQEQEEKQKQYDERRREYTSDPANWGEMPETTEFNKELESIVHSGRGEESAKEAEDLLMSVLQNIDDGVETSIKPSAISVNFVMRAWGMVGKDYVASRAEGLLRMQNERSQRPGQEALTPTVYSFSTVINCYANIGQPEKAENILRFQVEQYEAGNERARPNRVVYNTIIKAWSKSRLEGRERRSEEILRHMIRTSNKDPLCPKPDKITFNNVLGAYAKSTVWGSSRKALKLLEEMEVLNEKPGWRTKPDAITHLLVIQALGKERTLNASDLALELLHKLHKQYKETHDNAFKPNKIHYVSMYV